MQHLLPGVVLLLAAVALGDVVSTKGAGKLVGKVVSEGDEVVVNPYNSSHPEMVLDVRRVPASRVRSIKKTLPWPAHDFHRRLAAAVDASACVELAQWCKAQGDKIPLEHLSE